MTKTVAITKQEISEEQLEAELNALFRVMDRRLKNIRKRQAETARLRESTRAALDRMKVW